MADQLMRRWKLMVVLALSVVVVAVASSWAKPAQGRDVPGRPFPILQGPMVVSGDDIGFRIEGTVGGIQIGKIVVRINGVWVDAEVPSR